MIVQTAPEGAPRFVMRMSEHTSLSDQFVEHSEIRTSSL